MFGSAYFRKHNTIDYAYVIASYTKNGIRHTDEKIRVNGAYNDYFDNGKYGVKAFMEAHGYEKVFVKVVLKADYWEA